MYGTILEKYFNGSHKELIALLYDLNELSMGAYHLDRLVKDLNRYERVLKG